MPFYSHEFPVSLRRCRASDVRRCRVSAAAWSLGWGSDLPAAMDTQSCPTPSRETAGGAWRRTAVELLQRSRFGCLNHLSDFYHSCIQTNKSAWSVHFLYRRLFVDLNKLLEKELLPRRKKDKCDSLKSSFNKKQLLSLFDCYVIFSLMSHISIIMLLTSQPVIHLAVTAVYFRTSPCFLLNVSG